MDIGVFTWFGFRYPFDEIIKMIKDAGFQCVMTWWGDEFRETNGPKEMEPEIIRKNGLYIENTHFTFTGIDAQYIDVSKDYTAPEYLSKAMESANKLMNM